MSLQWHIRWRAGGGVTWNRSSTRPCICNKYCIQLLILSVAVYTSFFNDSGAHDATRDTGDTTLSHCHTVTVSRWRLLSLSDVRKSTGEAIMHGHHVSDGSVIETRSECALAARTKRCRALICTRVHSLQCTVHTRLTTQCPRSRLPFDPTKVKVKFRDFH